MQALLTTTNNQVSHELITLAKRYDDGDRSYATYNECMIKLADHLVHVGCSCPEYVGNNTSLALLLFMIKYRVYSGVQHCSICPHHKIYIEIGILDEPYNFRIYFKCPGQYFGGSSRILLSTLDELVGILDTYGLCDLLVKPVVDG